MDKPTKWAAGLSAMLAAIALATIFWAALIPHSRLPEEAAVEGITGIWEVAMSLILAVWIWWGFKMRRSKNTPHGKSSRTKWALGITAALVVAAITLLCVHGNRDEVTVDQVRVFTQLVLTGMLGSCALVWAIWYRAGMRR